MATNKISLVVKPTRSIPMVVKPVPKIGLMSMAPTKGGPGVGIESLEQTTKSTESGGTNVWTATLTDGTVHDFEVMNGDPGDGIATGGTPGQALIKASTADYATRWMSILPEDTASGSVASFPDGSDDLPMGVVVDIEPVQAGSGDPAPDNIRPISGWTKATISHSGADTSNPTEYEIPFSTEVYGGKLNVETGELVVDRAMVDLGTLDWLRSTSGDGKFYSTQATTPNYNGSTDATMVCSQYIFDGVGTAAKGYFGGNGTFRYYYEGNRAKELYVHDQSKDSMTAGQFKTAMSGVQLVYELATPITLTLDPVEIRSLLGDNNVFADTGDVSVTYKANIQGYIDKKISAAVAAMS